MVVRLLSAAVLGLGAVSWPAAAAAEASYGSAVSQYVQVIPRASGGTVLTSPRRSRPLLPAVATSPALGAPQQKLPKRAAARREVAAQGSFPSPTALADSGGRAPAVLAVVLGTAIVALGAWAIYRRTSA